MKRRLQMMIFSVDKFKHPKKVRRWIEAHDTKMLGYQKKPVKKYDDEYKVRIRERRFFNINSLKKEFVEKGVWAMFGDLEE